jgi:hypothetical protein
MKNRRDFIKKSATVNLFAVMKEFFNVGYKGYIYPEHGRFFTRDAEFSGYKKSHLSIFRSTT